MAELRTAIVHERFTELGGSEKVVEALARIWPEAHVYSPVVDPKVLHPDLVHMVQPTQWVQQLYRGDGRYAHLLPLLPHAMRHLPLADYDLVIASHHAFANRVRVRPSATMVTYVHSPARWMWDRELRAVESQSTLSSAVLNAFAASQRRPDRVAAGRPDLLVANSTEVSTRIRRSWGRTSSVVHPPVAVEQFSPTDSRPRKDFFLLAGRLVPYKRPEVAVAAASRAGLPLVVVGSGRSLEACRSVAGPTVTFLGSVPDEKLAELLQTCRALVFPGLEDFGIVPVEAQAAGAPVIGLDAGGLRDTVIPGKTGVLVEPTEDDDELIERFAHALATFRAGALLPSAAIAVHASAFREDRFAAEFVDEVQRVLNARSPGRVKR